MLGLAEVRAPCANLSGHRSPHRMGSDWMVSTAVKRQITGFSNLKLKTET